MIPTNYEQWRHCIVEKCGIPLTLPYIQTRIEVLRNEKSDETRKFRNRYGDAHWRLVLEWFERALQEARS